MMKKDHTGSTHLEENLGARRKTNRSTLQAENMFQILATQPSPVLHSPHMWSPAVRAEYPANWEITRNKEWICGCSRSDCKAVETYVAKNFSTWKWGSVTLHLDPATEPTSSPVTDTALSQAGLPKVQNKACHTLWWLLGWLYQGSAEWSEGTGTWISPRVRPKYRHDQYG